MTTERDYPYDPTLRLSDMAKATGLERLRWIPDRGLAGYLVTLWEAAHDPRRIAQCEKFDRVKAEERRQQLILIATSAARGDFGDEARDIADHYFGGGDIKRADSLRCEEFLKALQRLNIDVHSMPSRTRGGGRQRFSE